MLAETARRFDDIVARAQAVGRAPSVIAGLARGGEILHVAGAGEQTTRDTQYRIGSITKTMTATLVLQLRDEGRLGLDDALERHLPGTPLGDLTVRQLLGHISGLQREPDGPWWERAAGGDLESLLGKLTAGKRALRPHRTHHYSNLGFGLLGGVVERVTGQPWVDVVRDRLLGPLRMTRTTYHPQSPYAIGYVVHPWHQTLREEPRLDAGAMAPAGQLWSTVDDLSRWAAFLAEPDRAVLRPETMAEMCAPVAMSDVHSWRSGQGLGVNLWRRGDRVYAGHTGSMPGYLAVLVVHRASGLSAVAFANAYDLHGLDIGSLGLDLIDTGLDREPAPITPWRAASEPPADVVPLCGRWWWMGNEYTVRWAAPELVMSSMDSPQETAWRFTAQEPDRWRCRSGMNNGEVLTAVRDHAGQVVALDIATFVFRREPGTD
jgi:CubicO group peptidase (beta-lactamase class C family)